LYLKKKKFPKPAGFGNPVRPILLGFHNFGERILEQDLESHAMTTVAMSGEKIAVAFEHTIIKGHVVIIIVAMENHIKLIEAEPVPFLGVALGFVDLADHSRVHFQSPFYRR
jgi:hypothetical protein